MAIYQRVHFLQLLAVLTASALATGCNSESETIGQVEVGESCVSSDPNKICLAMHFVSYQDSQGKPVADEYQAAHIIQAMNKIYSQCGIGFQIENYEAVDPAGYGLGFAPQSMGELDKIRKTFDQPLYELLSVTTGHWSLSANAWTNMPSVGPFGAIVEASVVDYSDGLIYAHEFGHYLGLYHVADRSNLMNSESYKTSTHLTESQCETLRSTATSNWGGMVRK